jgi:transcription elongation factor Elf1
MNEKPRPKNLDRYYKCEDCGHCGLGPILRPDLWSAINGGNRRLIICTLCTEKRLGRHIQLDDLRSLDDAPCNDPIFVLLRRYADHTT